MSWRPIVGLPFGPAAFEGYVQAIAAGEMSWAPRFVVLHNTGAPSLAQRSQGLTRQHLANLEAYYRDQQGWSAGPHLFVDDHQIWTFSSLAHPGVHSPSWNKVAIGVEMLGDFEREAFGTGRGAKVRDLTIAALATLHRYLGLDLGQLKLHREDPKTTHACPGKNVTRADIVTRVRAALDVGPPACAGPKPGSGA